MSNTIYEEFLSVEKSFTSTSTSYRFIHTTSSNFYNDSSLVPIFCNRTSTDLDVRKLSSTTHNLGHGVSKLRNSSKVKDTVAIRVPLLSLNQESSKKRSLISSFRMQKHQTNLCTKCDFKFLNTKNLKTDILVKRHVMAMANGVRTTGPRFAAILSILRIYKPRLKIYLGIKNTD